MAVTVREKLKDIMHLIVWASISRNYFHKSDSWIYHKMDGVNSRGEENNFTDEELAQFKGALFDLADRIRKHAESL